MQSPENRKANFLTAVIAAIALVLGTYYVSNTYYFSQQNDELLRLAAKVNELKQANDENAQIKKNSEQTEIALVDAEKKYSSLKFLVPSEAELPQILNWLADKARGRNLKLEHFSQGTQTKQTGVIGEIPVQVEVLGYYDGVERFIEDFSRFERLLQVRSVHMMQEPQKDPTPVLVVRANISFSAYVIKDKPTVASLR